MTEGSYSLVCTEFCGTGHATMRAFVKVVSPDEFDDWVADQEKIPEGEEGLDSRGIRVQRARRAERRGSRRVNKVRD